MGGSLRRRDPTGLRANDERVLVSCRLSGAGKVPLRYDAGAGGGVGDEVVLAQDHAGDASSQECLAEFGAGGDDVLGGDGRGGSFPDAVGDVLDVVEEGGVDEAGCWRNDEYVRRVSGGEWERDGPS